MSESDARGRSGGERAARGSGTAGTIGGEQGGAVAAPTPHMPYRELEDSIEVSHIEHPDEELLTLNLGPHHPATHGVLRLLTTLDGEVVRDIKPMIGYVHTGIEKTAEDKAYWKVIPVVERMDYLAYYFNALAYCGAVETLLGIEVPKRGQYLRVIHMELNRIASHLLWLATGGLDLGAMSVFWYGWRDRDLILDLFEMSSGQRMHTRYFQVGGVIEDIPLGFAEKVREFTAQFPTRITQYEDLIDKNQIVLERLHGVAPVDEQTLLDLGVTGPLLRATGNTWDLRKATPYCSYEDFEFKIPVGTIGDNYDRYRVRMAEMRESVKIIDQALDGLPEGDYITSDRKYALPPRHELATSMEALIHHFKLVTEGFRVPPGEAYYPIESPRGELGCFVRADGSSKPARVHMRDPSFVNLQALRPMVKDLYLADLIATLAMLDPILGGIDR
ncbi:MAG TPA: NADH dehydrogenase (quinone) subunit D [Solirubrobacteraceae bacterium]|nr:NADH dehydrogenase (quinone) subunit D [Solirubrobacteraceae bacterium]